MKHITIMLIVCILLCSCGSDKSVEIDGHKQVVATQYGILNQDTKLDGVHYQLNIGNVVWSIILVETVVVPVVLLGFYLYEPL